MNLNQKKYEYCWHRFFFCKDYASERNESLLSNCRAQLILCKITFFFRKMQEIYGKMFESEEDKEKSPPLVR